MPDLTVKKNAEKISLSYSCSKVQAHSLLSMRYVGKLLVISGLARNEFVPSCTKNWTSRRIWQNSSCHLYWPYSLTESNNWWLTLFFKISLLFMISLFYIYLKVKSPPVFEKNENAIPKTLCFCLNNVLQKYQCFKNVFWFSLLHIYFTTHAKTISLQISTLTVIRLTWNKKVISIIERLTILLIFFSW